VTSSSATPPLDYDRLRESLSAAGAVVALAELHGGVCGALCAGGVDAARRWLVDSLDDAELGASPAAVADDLEELINTSAKMLEDAELRFEPLLPSDDEPLAEQVGALAEIHEYVRVSVQLAFEELGPIRAAAAREVH